MTRIIPFNGLNLEDVLKVAASVEEHSSHPIAEAICNKASELNIPVPQYEELEMAVGKGIKASVNGKMVLVGSKRFLTEWDISFEPLNNMNGETADRDANIVFVAYDKKLAGMIILEDKVREGMKKAINQLRRHGVDECYVDG
ncbi:HAD family hydrolase [Bacillus sp. T33-2]|uniref:HAD family hydrolase n=1 Tax=Bacillus sp. T33-2 TaxID=2054168 RepID=UPI000C785FE5|nr:HAD family hydrolase [Bacillus sp. T33-2]PLR95527.1 hypothetical protein CVD19_14015 [Bacillus sp. T33-2]